MASPRLAVAFLLLALGMAGCLDSAPASEAPEAGVPPQSPGVGSNPQPAPIGDGDAEPPQGVSTMVFRDCTRLNVGVAWPTQDFPLPPPEAWPPGEFYTSVLQVDFMDCTEVLLDDLAWVGNVQVCVISHSNIGIKDGAWDRAQFSALLVPLAILSSSEALVAALEANGFQDIALHGSASANHTMGESQVSSRGECSTETWSIAADVDAPLDDTRQRATIPVWRYLSEPAAPSWWSARYEEVVIDAAPNMATAFPGSLEVRGSTPFDDWPTRQDSVVAGALLGPSLNVTSTWTFGGTGLE